MNIVALAARLLLALMFAVAGAAKLADRKGSRLSLVDFGLPAVVAGPLVLLLPLAELAVAAALLHPVTALWGALCALALLIVFISGIGLNLARGRRPDCHCFGQAHSAPAGWKTLARNAALAGLAGFLLWQGWIGDTPPGAVGSPLVLLALAGAALLGGLLVYRRRRLSGGVVHSTDEVSVLPAGHRGTCGKGRAGGNEARRAAPAFRRVGEPAPEIELRGPSGEAVNLWSIQGEQTLVLFYNPDCVFCQRMLPSLKQREERSSEGAPEMLVISAGPQQLGLDSPVLFDRSRALFREFGAEETPAAVLVDAEGKVASEAALGAPAVLELAGARPERGVSGWTQKRRARSRKTMLKQGG